MRKVIILIGLIVGSYAASAQFQTTDSLERFINRYIRNSAVEAFQNLRLNTAMIGMLKFIDSAYGGQISSISATSDTTFRIITLNDDTLNTVVVGRHWTLQQVLTNGSTLTSNHTITISDSITYASGKVLIDQLRLTGLVTQSDTTLWKPAVLDGNGNQGRFDRWPGSGGVGGAGLSSNGITISGGVIKLGDSVTHAAATLAEDRYLRGGNKSIYFQGNKTNLGNANIIFDDTLTASFENPRFKTFMLFNSLDHVAPPYSIGVGSIDDGTMTSRNNHTFNLGFNFSPSSTQINSNYGAMGIGFEGSFQGLQEWHEKWISRGGTQYRLKSYTIDTATKDIDLFHTVSRHYYKRVSDASEFARLSYNGTASFMNLLGPTSTVSLSSANNAFSLSASPTVAEFHLSGMDAWFFPGVHFSSGFHNYEGYRAHNFYELQTNSYVDWRTQGALGNTFSAISTNTDAYSVPAIIGNNNAATRGFMVIANTASGFWYNNYVSVGAAGSASSTPGRATVFASGSELTSLMIGTDDNAANPPLNFMTDGVDRLRITGDGKLKTMTPPGSGVATDSILTWRASDSTIYKMPMSAGGSLSGSGASGQMALWNGGSSFTGNSSILWGTSNGPRISIGTTNTQGVLNLGGDKNLTSSGIQSYFASATYTNTTTAASGTASAAAINYIAGPTIAATNTGVTFPQISTLTVDAPTAGTNATITSAYAFVTGSNGHAKIQGNTEVDGALMAGGAQYNAVTTITATGTLATNIYWIEVNATSGNITLTLPAASSVFNSARGIEYKLSRVDASGNTVTIQRAGSDTIGAAGTSFSLNTADEVKTLQCVANNKWRVF